MRNVCILETFPCLYFILIYKERFGNPNVTQLWKFHSQDFVTKYLLRLLLFRRIMLYWLGLNNILLKSYFTSRMTTSILIQKYDFAILIQSYYLLNLLSKFRTSNTNSVWRIVWESIWSVLNMYISKCNKCIRVDPKLSDFNLMLLKVEIA